VRALIHSLPAFDVQAWWDALREKSRESFGGKVHIAWPEDAEARVVCRLEVCRAAAENEHGVVHLLYTWIKGFDGDYHHRTQLFGDWVVEPMVLDVARLFAPPEQPAQMQNVYNLIGHGSRVTVGSTDHSINVINISPDRVFDEMRSAIAASVEDSSERASLLERVEQLEQAKGTRRYADLYIQFVAGVTNHMTLFQPFLPALAQLYSALTP
jgi:hypothetical protein